ncbi:MAG: hypothetical protein NTW87_15285 [Planctomycetota bacterium]|nr:hypothetical protein [Planctomycetota bacterium]
MANWLSRLGGLFKKGDAERPPDPLDILISLIDPADLRTKIRPLGGDWLCPFSGKRFLVPHWDGVTDILQVPEIMEHLLSLPEIKRQGAAAQMRPWPELAEIVTVMRLREAQNYRILSERGEWYCPFCCINTGIERRQWDGSETPLEWFIPAALKHLQQCKDYLANRLTAKSVPELLRAKGDRAIRAELLSRVCHEEIFRVCADTGAWVCPFSRRAIETINLHAVPWGEQVQEAIVSYLMSPECPGRDTLWRTAVTVADLQRAAGRLSAGHAARAEAAEELQALRKRVDNLSATATSALEVQKELRAARAAQLKMLPSRPPLIPGYEVASFYEASVELGGDLYHFLEVRPGFTGFLVGDARLPCWSNLRTAPSASWKARAWPLASAPRTCMPGSSKNTRLPCSRAPCSSSIPTGFPKP